MPGGTPRPDEAKPRWKGPGTVAATLDQMKARISALLAKAESTTHEKEREAFVEKAESLMLKLGIEAAELEASGERKADKIVEQRLEWNGGFSMVMPGFVTELALGFGNITVLRSKGWKQRQLFTWVIGFEADVNTFVQLLTSLEQQSRSALKVFQKEHAEERSWMGRGPAYVQSRSFISGFGSECGKRLGDLRRRVQAEEPVSTGAALVLAEKQPQIDQWVRGHYTVKLGKSRDMMASHSGRTGGREAGRRADLGHNRVGGSRGAVEQ